MYACNIVNAQNELKWSKWILFCFVSDISYAYVSENENEYEMEKEFKLRIWIPPFVHSCFAIKNSFRGPCELRIYRL